jgi:hypothetical protein
VSTMHFKYTRHQVPRGSRPDAETFDKIYLIKNLTLFRATYQVRLLAFKAVETQKKLVLKVPPSCRFHDSLTDLIQKTAKTIKREDL